MAQQTIRTQRCRNCGKWLEPGTFAQGICPDGSSHRWSGATRTIEVAERISRRTDDACPCGSHGVFCPLSEDGEGPHQF